MSTTKSDLINAVTEAIGFPQNRSVEIVETLLDLIKAKLTAGEDVLITGFGKFCITTKRERRGRNPATGEDMMLEARKVLTLKCSRQLRDSKECGWYLPYQRGFRRRSTLDCLFYGVSDRNDFVHTDV